MRRIGPILALALCLVVAGAAADESRVVLISLDGTTPAQAADPALAGFARLRREGATAARLVPVFPTNTFPNHVSLVTGVAPDRHGIVNNVFVDPVRGRYSYEDDPSWMEAEPIWSLAARAGVVSAAYHWVGSEGAWRSGLGPRHWKRFEADAPESEKVDQVLAWLALADPRERPRLVTVWFGGADAAGHRGGPDARAVHAALRTQDAAIGRLLDALVERGLADSTTVLLVSDHGMAKVRRGLRLGAELERAGVRAQVLGGGGFASVVAREPGEAARAVAVARGLGLEAWLRAEAPAELRVGHPRFGDAVVLAPPGTALVGGDRPGGWAQALLARVGLAVGGAHGYRPELPEMGGIFLAWGAGVAPGAALGDVRTLDVAPTVLARLGVAVPDWMEGRPLALAPRVPADEKRVDSAR